MIKTVVIMMMMNTKMINIVDKNQEEDKLSNLMMMIVP